MNKVLGAQQSSCPGLLVRGIYVFERPLDSCYKYDVNGPMYVLIWLINHTRWKASESDSATILNQTVHHLFIHPSPIYDHSCEKRLALKLRLPISCSHKAHALMSLRTPL
jgi:hypothetical protein